MTGSPRSCVRWGVLGALVAAVTLGGCTSSEPDPRCRIEATGGQRDEIAKSVNGSTLWQAYFDHKRPARSGANPVVAFSLTMDRSTQATVGGDYDHGTVHVDFEAKNLTNGATLFTKQASVNLDSFMLGLFDKDTTREEFQEIAFRAVEDRVYPHLDTWINLAALKAIEQEGRSGNTLSPVLDELLEDEWTSQVMRRAAEKALAQITGRPA